MAYSNPTVKQLEEMADAIIDELEIGQDPTTLTNAITRFLIAADFTAQKFDTSVKAVLDIAFFPNADITDPVIEEFNHQLEHLS
jgi:hypothetical protein